MKKSMTEDPRNQRLQDVYLSRAGIAKIHLILSCRWPRGLSIPVAFESRELSKLLADMNSNLVL